MCQEKGLGSNRFHFTSHCDTGLLSLTHSTEPTLTSDGYFPRTETLLTIKSKLSVKLTSFMICKIKCIIIPVVF